jgi:hypothetical protein
MQEREERRGRGEETKETKRDQWMHVRVWSLNLLLFYQIPEDPTFPADIF